MWVLCGQFKEPLQSLGRPKFHLRQHCSIHTYMHSAGDRRQGQNMWLGRWYVKGILLKYPMLEPVLKLTWQSLHVFQRRWVTQISDKEIAGTMHIFFPVFITFLPLIASNLLFDFLTKSRWNQENHPWEFDFFAPRSEEDYEDEGRYLPGENELSCSCANLLLSSLGQAAGVQPQSMGIYERWQKRITQEQIRVPSGGKARNTVNDQSTVVLLQVFSISLNNQLTLVGW